MEGGGNFAAALFGLYRVRVKVKVRVRALPVGAKAPPENKK